MLKILLVVLGCVNCCVGILCFNCSASYFDEGTNCAGDFGLGTPFNATHSLLVNCSDDESMCFVRAWKMRAQHAWMVQRGCYRATKNDVFKSHLNAPLRSMTCRVERLPEADYRVCLCQADWCNRAARWSCEARLVTMLLVFTVSAVTHLPAEC